MKGTRQKKATHQHGLLGEKESLVLRDDLEVIGHTGIAEHRLDHLAAQVVVQHLHAALQQALQLCHLLRLHGAQLASFLPDFESSRLALLVHKNVFGQQAEAGEEPITRELWNRVLVQRLKSVRGRIILQRNTGCLPWTAAPKRWYAQIPQGTSSYLYHGVGLYSL